MLEKVENYIRQWKMLEKGDKVVVGLSGGADSAPTALQPSAHGRAS